jgi:hypothetical protein
MSNAATPFVPKDGKITIADNTGTPKTLVIPYEDGDLQISGLEASQQSHQEFRARGKVYSVRTVEDRPIEFTFTCHATQFLSDGTTATPFDVAMQLGVWSSAVTMSPNTGDAFLVKVTWTGERTNFGATADNTVVYKYCRLEVDFAEGMPGKFTVKGTAYNFSTDAYTYA